MNNIHIKTLTPIHIGSGVFLHNKTEFEKFNKGEDSFLGIIDEKKIMSLLGEKHIDEWVVSIERGKSIRDIFNKFSLCNKVSAYSKRTILNFSDNISDNATLKECIHNGMGVPYIPGSSIKGAIRTALLCYLFNSSEHNYNPNKTLRDAQRFESDIFGSSPNDDVFRFIQVGDAYFPKDCEIALTMILLNITSKTNLIDSSKQQIVECICPEASTTFHLKINKQYSDYCHKKNNNIKTIPPEFKDLKALFHAINTHTKRLLDEELDFWNDINNQKEGAHEYIDNIKKIHNMIDLNNNEKCILRIGHGSGWRFMTGAWTKKYPFFNSTIVPTCRRNNSYYEQYDFPKTRRIDEIDSDILGFVQLTQANN